MAKLNTGPVGFGAGGRPGLSASQHTHFAAESSFGTMHVGQVHLLPAAAAAGTSAGAGSGFFSGTGAFSASFLGSVATEPPKTKPPLPPPKAGVAEPVKENPVVTGGFAAGSEAAVDEVDRGATAGAPN